MVFSFYKIKYLEGEPILGRFYQEELSKVLEVKQTNKVFLVVKRKLILEYSNFPTHTVLSK